MYYPLTGNRISSLIDPTFVTTIVGSGLSACLGAGFGAWMAGYISEKNTARNILQKKINYAVSAHNKIAIITGSFLVFKKQTMESIDSYFSNRDEYIAKLKSYTCSKFTYDYDLLNFTSPKYPLTILENLTIEDSNIPPRVHGSIIEIGRIVEDLENFMKIRNTEHEEFRKNFGTAIQPTGREFYDKLFGINASSHGADQMYLTSMMGIKTHIDDVIFYSYLLTYDLSKYAKTLEKEYKSIGGKIKPQLFQGDYSEVEAKKLMPSIHDYHNWLQGYPPEDIPEIFKDDK